MFQPVGGMDQFPKGFQRKLGDVIQFDSEVMSIRQSDTGVTVAYKNTKTGATRQVTADYCVSCIPLAVLSGMDVNLSPTTMAAVKATQYSPNAKMGLQMKRRFWEEDDRIFGGHLYSNLPFGQFSYPSGGLFGNKGVLLGFYGNGRIANVVDMPAEGAYRACPHAREQSPSADPGRIRGRLLRLVGEGPVQPGRDGRRREHGRLVGRARNARQPHLPRLLRGQRQWGLAGRGRRGGLETGAATP